MIAKGFVVARTGNSYQVQLQSSETVSCHARSKSIQAVCGDFVEVDIEPQMAVIVSIQQRKNKIERIDRFNRTKTLAANIDQLIVVTAARPTYDISGIDRYLIYANSIAANTCIVFNKYDIEPHQGSSFAELQHIYQAIGYLVIATSTLDGHGLNALQANLSGKSNIMVGQSGVGKSSIVNALIPDQCAAIGDLSDSIEQGTHTTSQTRSYLMPNGGQLIDSPGIRQFTPLISDYRTIHSGFIEIAERAHRCRFHNCRHVREPNCAVKVAVEHNEINPQRYASYLSLISELAADV